VNEVEEQMLGYILSRSADALFVTCMLLPGVHATTRCACYYQVCMLRLFTAGYHQVCACLRLLTAYVADGGGHRHSTEPPLATHPFRLRPLLHAGP